MPVPRPKNESALGEYLTDIEQTFDLAQTSVYTDAELQAWVRHKRAAWRLRSVPIAHIVEYLLQGSQLRLVELKSANYTPVHRFTWGTAPSPYELALSLRPNAYLSHGTAANLCGLLKDPPLVFHINKEQSPKEQSGTLTQEGITRAFSSRPRTSNLVYSHEDGRSFVIIAGKFTDRLGVGSVKGPSGERLYATRIERTLVDITVRPVYCGGPAKVLDAYRSARNALSVKRLMTTLKGLGHLYPYHQAIGFYLERAGFDNAALDLARRQGLEFDFYLTHGMDDMIYDKTWRIHHPRTL